MSQGSLPRSASIDQIKSTSSKENSDLLDIEKDLGFNSLEKIELVSKLSKLFCLEQTGIDENLISERNVFNWNSLVADHFERVGSSARITFETSGSVGTPKLVTHRYEDLVSEIDAIQSGPLSRTNVRASIFCAVPTHHIYGFLWGVILPSALEAEVIDLPPGYISPVFNAARKGDIVLATPNAWEVAATFGKHLTETVTGVCSGGPTTRGTWDGATAIDVHRFLDIYGSSETGGLGWRDDPDTPYRLFDDIYRSAHGLHRVAPSRPKLRVQDKLIWCSDREFYLGGRLDDVVQVAGNNVSLGLVKSKITDIEGIKDVAVRLDKDRLKAFVVPLYFDAGKERLKEKIMSQLLSLPSAARPSSFAFG